MWGHARLAVALLLGAIAGIGVDRLLARGDVQALEAELGALRLRVERLEQELRQLRAPPPPELPPPELPPRLPDGACSTCITSAASGDVVAAARAARECSDEVQKERCVATVKKSAPGVAKTAAFNNQCGAAKAIAAAAEGMGAGSSSLKRAVSSCQ